MQQQKALKVVLLSQLLIEAVEDIQDTNLYKREVKNLGNRLIKSLEPIAKQYDNVHAEDETLTNNLSNNIEELIGKMTKCDVQELLMINQIHDHYKNDKENWNNLFEVELVKLDA